MFASDLLPSESKRRPAVADFMPPRRRLAMPVASVPAAARDRDVALRPAARQPEAEEPSAPAWAWVRPRPKSIFDTISREREAAREAKAAERKPARPAKRLRLY